MKSRDNKKPMGILNYEGDVLKIIIAEDGYTINVLDQWDCHVESLSFEGLLDFLDGEREIVDSSGKSWNWVEEHKDSKAYLTDIYRYIGI